MLIEDVTVRAFVSVLGLTLLVWIVGCGAILRLWRGRRRSRGLLAELLFVSALSAVVVAILVGEGALSHPRVLAMMGLASVGLSCAAWALWFRATPRVP